MPDPQQSSQAHPEPNAPPGHPVFFAHPSALVESETVGAGTRIWAFAHVLAGARIGADCNVCDHVFVENDVVIGNHVTLKSGVQVWDGVHLEDEVFVGPNATFTNDRMPRSGHTPAAFAKTRVCRGASVGANATILPGLTIGLGAMVGAGAVVTRDVPPHAIVTGNPARITGYVDANGQRTGAPAARSLSRRQGDIQPGALNVPGARLVRLPTVVDLRGALTFGEIGTHLPFEPRRFFVVYDVPGKDIRGEHAHRELHQFLVCLKGSVSVVVDNGRERDEVQLGGPDTGLYLPPMIWGIQYQFSADATMLVLASDVYKAEDYIRDYGSYLRERGIDK